MTATARLALPLIEAGQAQKHVTHNEALAALDRLVQALVLDRDLAAPPASPAEGAGYIVAASPTGAWTGQAGRIATWVDGGWTFTVPAAGLRVWLADEARLMVWTGSAWVDPVSGAIGAISALQNLTRLGIGTTADATNPLAAKLNTMLFAALATGEGGTGDLRQTASKEAAGNTLSLLFQTAYSGRAELGLVGSDDFSLKVSADGASWTEALKLVAASGDTVARVVRPDADNARTLGTASARWSQIYAASATINTSDRREKVDIAEADLGLDFVRRLRPVSYRWRVAEQVADPADPAAPPVPREGRRRHFGLIAQEVAAALDGRDAALWVRDAETGLEGLRYAEFVPVLVKAVQDLAGRLDRLEQGARLDQPAQPAL
ncbi:hypothetical protein ABB55_21770 [Prosthecomicrobium hirschii]|uniref:Peptidase S74 domain-containing protein n=1 Tax=Prosthecodimorpha hirschii TaxID=665126 RepID=A0A0P6WI96_9HYPH|nr:DUF2793 domain-containing protein [Prosthecomicrobium hirschii]KPL54525.1 hypothetical protein ABB55_21770 [Prosthecomicrobium hirschii]